MNRWHAIAAVVMVSCVALAAVDIVRGRASQITWSAPGVNRVAVFGSTPATSYLLDTYTGAAGAWSFRTLASSYASADIVIVRRSSDNQTNGFTAAEIADGTLTGWVGAADGRVVWLADQSGNGRHATNATTTAQPWLVTNGSLVTVSGKPGAYWGGSTLTFVPITCTSTWYMAGIGRKASANMSTFLRSQSSPPINMSHFDDNVIYVQRGNPGRVYIASAAINFTNNWMLSSIAASNSISLFTNSIACAATAFGSSAAGTDFDRIGNTDGNCNKAEILLWLADQTSVRSNIEAAVNSHYGLW